MAETAVSFLLGKLGPFLVEEARTLRGVEAKAQWIKDELERINAFLRVADENAETNPQLKVWVKQVRDIAYEIEDALDVFELRMARNQGDGFYGFIRKISCTIKNAKYLHQLASSIQGIESRVKDVADGQKRYDSILHSSRQGSTATRNIWHERRADALWVKEAELVGIDKHRKQLIQWLVEESNPKFQVISVVGMGGLGKSTLAKKVFDADEVKKHFQIHAWVNVSQSFNLEMLLRDMIRQLFKEGGNEKLPRRLEEVGSNDLKEKINYFLQKKSYIIVLDDVWKLEHWDAIKFAFPHNKFGSRVMLTTRSLDVALGASRESKGRVYTLERFSPMDSRILFCRKAFQEDDCPDELKGIVEHILERCKGLPLAIVAIAGVLASKSKIDEWMMVKDSLGDELEGNYMSKVLLLSYYDLPYYLKACFLYLSAFPEDCGIRCKRVIRLWIAEGFVEPKEGKTLEEVAMGYLNELISRSLIQVASTDILDGRVRECRVHGLLRELILRMSKEQNFMAVVDETMPWLEKTRRLAIVKMKRDEQELKNFPQLRSVLFVRGSFEDKSSFLHRDIKLLRVLDLQGVRFRVIPNSVFNQYHLRYLSLRDTKVEMIPNSIGRLRNLEVLDLRGTDITNLPTTILKLELLRHLMCGHSRFPQSSLHSYGFEAIPGIGFLQYLQTLYYVELNGNEAILEELGRLKQLRKLGVRNLGKEQGFIFCSSLGNLGKLQNLSVESICQNEILDLQYLSSPPKFLERLHLSGRLAVVPPWISSLQKLIKLSLSATQLQEDQFVYLQSLPSLLSLSLRHEAYVGETLCFKASSLKKLRFLSLYMLTNLKQVIVEEGAISSLEEMEFIACQCLEEVPSGIEHLTDLKSLILQHPSQDLINSIDCTKGGEAYHKVKNIPSIRIFIYPNSWYNLPRERD